MNTGPELPLAPQFSFLFFFLAVSLSVRSSAKNDEPCGGGKSAAARGDAPVEAKRAGARSRWKTVLVPGASVVAVPQARNNNVHANAGARRRGVARNKASR